MDENRWIPNICDILRRSHINWRVITRTEFHIRYSPIFSLIFVFRRNCTSTNFRRIAENIGRVMCRLVYLYILTVHHYAPSTFSALPNFWKRQLLANTVCESQFSRLLVNLCKNVWEYYEYSEFAYSRPFSENQHICGSTFSKKFGSAEKSIQCNNDKYGEYTNTLIHTLGLRQVIQNEIIFSNNQSSHADSFVVDTKN